MSVHYSTRTRTTLGFCPKCFELTTVQLLLIELYYVWTVECKILSLDSLL